MAMIRRYEPTSPWADRRYVAIEIRDGQQKATAIRADGRRTRSCYTRERITRELAEGGLRCVFAVEAACRVVQEKA